MLLAVADRLALKAMAPPLIRPGRIATENVALAG
jgi:hypothetical protein